MHETINKLLDTIHNLDDKLMQYKEVIDKYAGQEIPEELIDEVQAACGRIVYMMFLRRRAAKILFKYHGIIVPNGWES